MYIRIDGKRKYEEKLNRKKSVLLLQIDIFNIFSLQGDFAIFYRKSNNDLTQIENNGKIDMGCRSTETMETKHKLFDPDGQTSLFILSFIRVYVACAYAGVCVNLVVWFHLYLLFCQPSLSFCILYIQHTSIVHTVDNTM